MFDKGQKQSSTLSCDSSYLFICNKFTNFTLAVNTEDKNKDAGAFFGHTELNSFQRNVQPPC